MSARELEPRRLTGRCMNGAERDRGSLWHAVEAGTMWGAALCRAKPGRTSGGWSDVRGESVTCPCCLRRAARVGPVRIDVAPDGSEVSARWLTGSLTLSHEGWTWEEVRDQLLAAGLNEDANVRVLSPDDDEETTVVGLAIHA